MHQLELTDVERIVHLVAEAGDPTVEMTLPERKRLLLEGVAELIGAHVWLWSTAVPNPKVAGDISTTCLIDGGWKDVQEQKVVYETLTDPDFNKLTGVAVKELARTGEFKTVLREELVSVEQRELVDKLWRRTGLEHFVFTIYPLGGQQFSAIGFHRRRGMPNFTERERAIIHVLFKQVDWLHRHGTNEPAQGKVVQLAPRERQVLMLLLSGNSRKEIAHTLSISEHTVGDYMKKLHKHFEVNSRAELQGYFLSGGRKPSQTDRLSSGDG